MAEEQGIAKVDLSYITKAVMMGNSLYSNDWQKGVLYLTNMNLWFSMGQQGWSTIPLKNITMIGREVTDALRAKAQKATGTSNVLIIDYMHPSSISQGSSASSIALLAGPEPVINTLKAYLLPMCGQAPRARSLNEIDKKLLYMFYTGVTELQKINFLIGADMDTLTNSFENLKEQQLCDSSGSLTTRGMQKIKEMMG
ncbi:hypothetical protein Mzhil_0565 [Methanosalsum zhilinae DSM 4017]|uniref:Uncharacterized protein n=1 Tax=Methanosalsum zhilinae (strain DSM 4017 / NBRC 107636 / OCM 62 / WeN5) TaxID=679901 RepID=F7XQ68_METZD|nr:hypothetical protein [Methanosalsum zhilinae]AEH60432.1 hypothetical protein Mzhil_0565 [Methanosalsum zhilinae DSM 4017]